MSVETTNPTLERGYFIRAAEHVDETCKLISPSEAKAAIANDRTVTWIDIVVTDKAAGEKLLIEDFGFHRLAVEDALSEHERPTLQEFADYVFFACPALASESGDPAYLEVGFFLMKSAVVTVALRTCPTIELWFDRWCKHPQRLGSSPAMLMHAIVDGIVDAYFPMVDGLEERLDELADRIFAGDITLVKEVLGLKRSFLDMRRRIAPLRDIINQLLRNDLELVPDDTKPYFQDVFDHVIRLYEILDVNRETLASLLDVHLSQVSNNLNIVVKKMTVFATVLMIMTLVTSVYGMNVRSLPLANLPSSFLDVMIAMGVSGLVTWLCFKKFGWI